MINSQIKILGKTLPDKIMLYSLRVFYGIGLTKSKNILQELNLDPNSKPSSLKNEEISSLTAYLRDKCNLEANLRNSVKFSCLSLVKKGCYRGKRHIAKLPVRGQRTSTNAKTNKRLPRRYVL